MESALEATRRLALELRPTVLDDLGLEAALFRIAQEAIINLARHSGARQASISLASEDGGVRLSVRDDGRGFDPGTRDPGSLGILSMEERVRANGGLLAIRSAPGSGATVEAWFPDPPVSEKEPELEPEGGATDDEGSSER